MTAGKIFRGVNGLAIAVSLSAVAVSLALWGCSGSGNTDGGHAAANAKFGDQYVSDGAAGATLSFEFTQSANIPGAGGPSLLVGGTSGFFVTVKDSRGRPLPYIRISCDTEQGLAIVEPSTGREHTNSEGRMSGRVGGVYPGSFLMECRGPQGFNLLGRAELVVGGDVPPGFVGWPGAAGGNLGGGVSYDQTPTPREGFGVASVTIWSKYRGEENALSIVDILQVYDCVEGDTKETTLFDENGNPVYKQNKPQTDDNGDPIVEKVPATDKEGNLVYDDKGNVVMKEIPVLGPSDEVQTVVEERITHETMYWNHFTLDVYNNSNEAIYLGTVGIRIDDYELASTVVPVELTALLRPGQSVQVSGLFSDFPYGKQPAGDHYVDGSTKVLVGTDHFFTGGTFPVEFVIMGRSESGDSVSAGAIQSVTFGNVNNCS